MTKSGKIIQIVLLVAVLILLIAVYRSCRAGSRPPAESGTLNETSSGAPATLAHQPKAFAAAQANLHADNR